MLEFDFARPLDIICIGRANLDFNPVDMGKKLSECFTFKKYLGGSPANISVGMAKLGCRSAFLGRVADDRFGEFVVDYLREQGVETSYVHKCAPGVTQGLAFTEVLDGKSSLIMYRNNAADLDLRVEDIDEDYIKSARIVLISGTALAASPSREAALKALELAVRNRCTIVFDIDYRAYTWKNADEIAVYYAYAAKNADIIMGSREEFDLTEKLISPENTDEESARLWFGRRAQIVAIKHGKEGSFVFVKDGTKYTVSPPPVKLLKSFGGGDGYGSAFLYGLLSGKSIARSLEYATGSASMLVASHACSADMPDQEGLEKLVSETNQKYGSMVTGEPFD